MAVSVSKNLKGPFGIFLTFVLLQDIKQKERWTLCRHQKFLKKNENFEQSHSAENSEETLWDF